MQGATSAMAPLNNASRFTVSCFSPSKLDDQIGLSPRRALDATPGVVGASGV